MNQLYFWLNELDHDPCKWPGGAKKKVALKFIAAFKLIVADLAEDITTESKLAAYVDACRFASHAYAAAKSFDSSVPDLPLDTPPGYPVLPSPPSGEVPAEANEGEPPAPQAASTAEPLQCTPCRALFHLGELPSQRSSPACPMCGDPLVAAAPEDSGDDYRWWARENPNFRLPHVRGFDFSEHVGNIVFVEVAALRVDPDPIRPLQNRTVEDIRVSLRINPLIGPVGVTVEGRLCFGRHRYHAHVGESRRWIKAHILRDAPQTEYLALAENVARAELCALQQGVALRRMQEIYEAIHPETKQGVAGGKAGGRGRRAEQAQNSAPATPTPSFCSDAGAKVGKSGRAIQALVQIGRIAPTAQQVLMGTEAKDKQSVLLKVARAGSEAEQVALAEQIRSNELAPPAKPATAPQEPTTLSIALREEGGVRLGEGRMGNRWVRIRVEGDLLKVEFSRAATAGPNAEASPDNSSSA
ncbi:MAG TPA: hypothetical protein VFS43_20690 [Polyangiaceae bacterium]|nr:hypothetical protein [Polyangiaceae bacterium]